MQSSLLPHDANRWRTAPAHLDWLPDTVDVWRGIVDCPQAQLQDFWGMLSPDERLRAQRFRVPNHQKRFIAAHGMLRDILARYTDRAPEALSFVSGPHGKPALALEASYPPLFFNMTHSDALALYAVSPDREIGIDIEKDRPALPCERIAARIMTDEEHTQFSQFPAEERLQAFLTCWTRKEAFVKAIGTGLRFPLNQVVVSCFLRHPPQMVRVIGESSLAGDWSIRDLVPGEGYTAALVTAGRQPSVRSWQWAR